WIGASRSTQPRTDGPTTMPATISSTTAGTRARGASPNSSGIANATAATTNRLDRDTSGVMGGLPPSGERATACRHQRRWFVSRLRRSLHRRPALPAAILNETGQTTRGGGPVRVVAVNASAHGQPGIGVALPAAGFVVLGVAHRRSGRSLG